MVLQMSVPCCLALLGMGNPGGVCLQAVVLTQVGDNEDHAQVSRGERWKYKIEYTGQTLDTKNLTLHDAQ